jgi:SAM-dependent methyltransferase
MIEAERDREALEWQSGVWNRISAIYRQEIDQRFAPVVEAVIARARVTAGESILDLGTGTGAVAERAAAIVGTSGYVVGVDISPDMRALTQKRLAARGLPNVTLREGRAESIPADDHTFNVVLSSLTLMYVIDRAAAAREIARVLRPGGRLIASVWAGPDACDIVLFQQTAGRFAGPPPVSGVGPGALADPTVFLQQLADAGIDARVETETLGFDFPDFLSAWKALAGVTTAHLPAERQQEAQRAVMGVMYPRGDGPRHFRNLTQFIVGRAGG